MSLVYRLMYRLGFAPWDAGVPAELTAMIEGPDALPVGRALDLGSGKGGKAVHGPARLEGDRRRERAGGDARGEAPRR